MLLCAVTAVTSMPLHHHLNAIQSITHYSHTHSLSTQFFACTLHNLVTLFRVGDMCKQGNQSSGNIFALFSFVALSCVTNHHCQFHRTLSSMHILWVAEQSSSENCQAKIRPINLLTRTHSHSVELKRQRPKEEKSEKFQVEMESKGMIERRGERERQSESESDERKRGNAGKKCVLIF